MVAKSVSRTVRRPSPRSRAPGRESDVRHRILAVARSQYMRLGFSAVTMDETAEAAGVSKKTLYRHFPGKDGLLQAVTQSHMEECRSCLQSIYGNGKLGPVRRLRGMMDYVAGIYREISVSLVHDLRRCAPEVWRDVENLRRAHIENDFSALLREGRAKGHFRKDVDARIFLLIYAEVVQRILNPESFARLKIAPARLFEAVCKVLFEGILTDKARREYHHEKP
jgi:AcrR family transcriptional regulator